MAVKLTWYGHACWAFDSDYGRVLVDPFFSGNPAAPLPAGKVQADFILVSHGHGDHLGDTVAIARRTGALVISNYEIAQHVEKQGCKVHAMHIGGGHQFPFGRVKLTIAHHGSSLPDGSYGGSPAGFLLTIDKKKIYDAADTGLFYDMRLIGEENIDVALLPIGDNFTMGPEDAVRAARLIKPRTVIPMHYNTFDVISQDPKSFASRLRQALPKTKVVIMQPGETFSL